MMVIDTHVFIWFFSCPAKLTSKAAEALDKAETLVIPSIVLWEIAMLAGRNRITLPYRWTAWLKDVCEQPGIHIQPITPDIAALSVIPNMHGDPADRLVVATARALDLPLITADYKIQKLGLVTTIW